jgi:hypothetical protein
MVANPPFQEKELVDQAVSWLRDTLPPTWTVQVSDRDVVSAGPNQAQTRIDAMISVQAPQGATSFIVEAKRSLMPKDAQVIFSGLARQFRTLYPNQPVLVVAPWISSRTQEVLASEKINFIDLTGNARIAVDYPSLFVTSQGAIRDPSPVTRGKPGLRGPKAGRVFRLLADVAPPYGVSQISKATGVALGYVSRLLDTLDEEALIERSARGQVVSTDLPRILRRWAETYDIFKSNRATSFVAPQGPADLLNRLKSPRESVVTVTSRPGTIQGPPRPVVVTGSFAAVRLAPVANPALLTVYSDDMIGFANKFSLLESDRGANVIVLQPFDDVVWDRTTWVDGIRFASPSQVAVDCLTGNGRMPSEGEAVLTWLLDSEPAWRLQSIDELGPPRIP